MRGVKYFHNARGKKTEVLIDLEPVDCRRTVHAVDGPNLHVAVDRNDVVSALRNRDSRTPRAQARRAIRRPR